MLDSIKNLNPFKLFPALKESLNKAKESKDKGFFEKVSIFFSTFMAEMNKVEEEKGKTTDETKKDVSQGVEEMIGDVKKRVELKTDGLDDGAKQAYEMGLATTVKNFESMDDGHQSAGLNAFEKLDKAMGGNVQSLSVSETEALAGSALMTLSDLKKQYPDKAKLKEALENIEKASNNSKYPLSRLFDLGVLKIFKLSTDDSETILKKFGIELSTGDKVGYGINAVANMVGAGDVVENKVSEVKSIFAGLKEKPPKNKDKIVKFIGDHFLKNTSKVSEVVDVINEMIVSESPRITTDHLAELTDLVNEKDFENLIAMLVGKRNSPEAKVA